MRSSQTVLSGSPRPGSTLLQESDDVAVVKGVQRQEAFTDDAACVAAACAREVCLV